MQVQGQSTVTYSNPHQVCERCCHQSCSRRALSFLQSDHKQTNYTYVQLAEPQNTSSGAAGAVSSYHPNRQLLQGAGGGGSHSSSSRRRSKSCSTVREFGSPMLVRSLTTDILYSMHACHQVCSSCNCRCVSYGTYSYRFSCGVCYTIHVNVEYSRRTCVNNSSRMTRPK